MTTIGKPNFTNAGCGCDECVYCIQYNVNPDPLTAVLTGGAMSEFDDEGRLYPSKIIDFLFGAVQIDATAHWFIAEPIYFGTGGSPFPKFVLRNNCCDSEEKCTLAVLSRFEPLTGPDGPVIYLDDDVFNPSLKNIKAKFEWTCASPTWTLVYYSSGNAAATFVGLTNTA